MEKRPFLCLGSASFLSALLCSWLSLRGVAVVMIAAFCAFVLLTIVCRRTRWRVLPLLAAGAMLASTAFYIKERAVVYPQLSLAGETVEVTVRVCDKLNTSGAYEVKTESGDLAKGIKLCLWVSGEAITPKNGDLLSGEVQLTSNYDGERFGEVTYAKSDDLYLYAWPTTYGGLTWEDGQESLVFPDSVLYPLRERIHNTLYRSLPYDAAALCESMTIGQRLNLSADIRFAFRASGVYHLLAVSGLHLSVITGAVLRCLSAMRVKRRPRSLIAMAATVLFMALCGFTASVTRAGVMMLILLSAGLFRRRADGLNSLGFAAFIMLLTDPFCVLDIAWQLSFAATLGLLVMLPTWERDITDRVANALPLWLSGIVRPLVSAVGVSLCATLMTQPLTALYYGEVSSVFIIGNLLCVSMASVLLIVCFAGLLIAWLPLMSSAVFGMAKGICAWLIHITAALSELPFALLAVPPVPTALWCAALLAAIILGYRRMKWRGAARAGAVLAAVLLAAILLYTAATFGMMYVTVVQADSPVLIVETQDSSGLLFSGDGEALAEAAYMLHSRGITRLDWVLWMNEPSPQAIAVSRFSVEIDRLYTAGDSTAYAALPTASKTIPLALGEYADIADNGCIKREDDGYRLTLGATSWFVCPTMSSETWSQADVICVGVDAAQDPPSSWTQALVACGSFRDCEDWKTLLSDRDDAVYFTPYDGAMTFQTRGLHDISLRSW